MKINLNNGEKKERIQPIRNLLTSLSVCTILSAIATGYDTRDLIIKKKGEGIGFLSQGTVTQLIGKNGELLEVDVVKILNPEANKRMGEKFKFAIEYEKLIEMMGKLFIDEVNEDKRLINQVISTIERRESVIQNNLENYNRLQRLYTKKNKKKRSKFSLEISKINHSLNLYNNMKIVIENFKNFVNELLLPINYIGEEEKTIITHSLNSLFYMTIISGKKDMTLKKLFGIFSNWVKKGKLPYLKYGQFDKNEGLEDTLGFVIGKSQIFLYRLNKYWEFKDKFNIFY